MDATHEQSITYRDDERPTIPTIIALYGAAGLVRPIDDPARIARMYAGANLVLTAWAGETLVGILRGWTDDGFLGYIADLAVHPDHQRSGIGRELLSQALATNREVTFILNAAPEAADYYHHIGWTKIENSWRWPRDR